MKLKLITIICLFGFTYPSFSKTLNSNGEDPVKNKSFNKTEINNPSPKTIFSPATFGIEKGMRVNCAPGSKKICCDIKFCFVTPLSKKFDEEGGDAPVLALNYMEASIEVVNNQLELIIPFNKILPEVYKDWFIDDIFNAEYFPLEDYVSNLFGLTNIAIVAGKYPVVRTNTGFKIHVNYITQTSE